MVSKIKPNVDEQYKLLDVEPAKDQTKAGSGNAGFNDPAFVSNKMLPVQRRVPWIAGFASEFVRDIFNRYLSVVQSLVIASPLIEHSLYSSMTLYTTPSAEFIILKLFRHPLGPFSYEDRHEMVRQILNVDLAAAQIKCIFNG